MIVGVREKTVREVHRDHRQELGTKKLLTLDSNPLSRGEIFIERKRYPWNF